MSSVIQKAKGDKVIWAVVLLLSLLSVVVVYSSSAALASRFKDGNSFYYLAKHGSIVVLGFILAYFTHKIKYSYYSRLSQIAMILAVPLLLFTLLKGVNVGNATRWLEIPGTGLTFQTSDFAKLALIMYVARMLSIKQDQIKDFKGAFIPIIVPIVIICVLILPANFSTAAVLFTTCMVLMFIGRMNMKYVFILLASGIVAFFLFIGIVKMLPEDMQQKTRVPTWIARWERFRSGDSESNYQAEQAKIAIASGGLIGKGPGNSIQRNFLPQASSDFIYAIIIEELGFVLGGLGILFLYLVLMFRAVRIVTRSPKTFGSLLAIGLCFSLVFQALINMAVAVGLFPVTGQPLPLVSMGGTSIWFTSIAVGIILGVSREIEKEEESKAGGGILDAA